MMKDPLPFWNWFSENNTRFRNMQQYDAAKITCLLDEIVGELKKYAEGLYAELGGRKAPFELIITAQGMSEYFADAAYLVLQAPPVEDWTFFALKPAHGTQFDFRMGDMELKPQSIFFRPLTDEEDGERIGVCILHSDYQTEDKERQQTLINGLYYCLDAVLGERSVTLDLNFLEFEVLPEGTEAEGILPVSELVNYISWRKKERQGYEVRFPESETTLLQGVREEKPVFLLVNRKYRYYHYTDDYPYLLYVILDFNDPRENGLPSESMEGIYEMEDLIDGIIGEHGHHIVSQTYNGKRTLYCYIDTLDHAREFSDKIRRCVISHTITTDITFDKYWISVREYM